MIDDLIHIDEFKLKDKLDDFYNSDYIKFLEARLTELPNYNRNVMSSAIRFAYLHRAAGRFNQIESLETGLYLAEHNQAEKSVVTAIKKGGKGLLNLVLSNETGKISQSKLGLHLTTELISILKDREFDPQDFDMISRAISLANKYHQNKKRFQEGFDGKPLSYLTHDLETALIVALLGHDAATIAGAVLHDVADLLKTEDERETAFKEILRATNSTVEFLVRGCTDPFIKIGVKEVEKGEIFSHALAEAYIDPRILIIKGADRYSNIRSIEEYAKVKGKLEASRILYQTYNYYLPMLKEIDQTLYNALQILLKSYSERIVRNIKFSYETKTKSLVDAVTIRPRWDRKKSYKYAFTLRMLNDFKKSHAGSIGLIDVDSGDFVLKTQSLEVINLLDTFPNLRIEEGLDRNKSTYVNPDLFLQRDKIPLKVSHEISEIRYLSLPNYPLVKFKIIIGNFDRYKNTFVRNPYRAYENFKAAYTLYLTSKLDERWLYDYFSPDETNSVTKLTHCDLSFNSNLTMMVERKEAEKYLAQRLDDKDLRMLILQNPDRPFYYMSYTSKNDDVNAEIQKLNELLGIEPIHVFYDVESHQKGTEKIKIVYDRGAKKIDSNGVRFLAAEINFGLNSKSI